MRKTLLLGVLLPLTGLLAVGAAAVGWYHRGPPTVPAQYRSLVLSAAASCPGLDPRLLAAQIEQESGWDERASSRVGAQGIAQFMPAVWDAYAVDGDGDGVRDVWNARDAIPSAAHFDCVLMRDVSGVPGDRVRNMLAAYNAGPDQVRRYRGVPPFRETRAYVQVIVDRSKVLTVGPRV
jgi:soluble lytic murein transglycosylase-like protein